MRPNEDTTVDLGWGALIGFRFGELFLGLGMGANVFGELGLAKLLEFRRPSQESGLIFGRPIAKGFHHPVERILKLSQIVLAADSQLRTVVS